jgi:hypothetical protein
MLHLTSCDRDPPELSDEVDYLADQIEQNIDDIGFFCCVGGDPLTTGEVYETDKFSDDQRALIINALRAYS